MANGRVMNMAGEGQKRRRKEGRKEGRPVQVACVEGQRCTGWVWRSSVEPGRVEPNEPVPMRPRLHRRPPALPQLLPGNALSTPRGPSRPSHASLRGVLLERDHSAAVGHILEIEPASSGRCCRSRKRDGRAL